MSTAKKALKGVTIHNPKRVYDGYTLIAPLGGYNIWLINNNGEIVHHWPLEHQPAFFGRLLPNGNMLYQGMEEANPQGPVLKVLDADGNVVVNLVMGGGEYLTELDWNGNKVWEYRNALLNHDFFRMDNGNTMAICYELIPEELKNKTKGGISIGDNVEMWGDKLVEINPDGEIIWEWKAHEHLDFDKDVYCALEHRAEWTHMNTCTVLPDGDILGSFRTLDLIIRIDKETKKVKWRFGEGKIAHQHEPTLLDNGNILVFDNGEHRKYSRYSYTKLIEINPETGEIVWEYEEDPKYSWFCGCQGGCQRLENGNTIISDTMTGRVFEVTHAGEKVWEYMSPFYGTHGFEEPNPMIYRVYKYHRDFDAFKGKKLDPKKYRWVNKLYGPEALKQDQIVKNAAKEMPRLLIGLTVNHLWKTFIGYTLYAPLGGKEARLIDMSGNLVNKWKLPNSPALYTELLPNSNLLIAGHVEGGPLADIEGAGGVIVELDWDNKEVWKYEDPYLHHAFYRYENGNTLVLKWEKVPDDLAKKVKHGFEGSERDGDMYADVIQEIDKDKKVVWEWKAVDHLDIEKDQICPLCERNEWSGGNAISVFPDGNILLSCRRTNTVCRINKKTGDIDWRWGQHEIGHQNCAIALENGHVLLFDNGLHAEGIHHTFSRIIEIDPVENKMVWNYRDEDNDNGIFYSCFMSGCQRLPNGNTLIAEANFGRIFEVTKKGETVWEYVNPDFRKVSGYGNNNVVPRAFRYGLDYSGLKGVKDIGLGPIIQTEADVKRNKRLKEERDKGPEKQDKKEKDFRVESRLEKLGY